MDTDLFFKFMDTTHQSLYILWNRKAMVQATDDGLTTQISVATMVRSEDMFRWESRHTGLFVGVETVRHYPQLSRHLGTALSKFFKFVLGLPNLYHQGTNCFTLTHNSPRYSCLGVLTEIDTTEPDSSTI